MLAFWGGIIALCLLAAVFLLWPLWRPAQLASVVDRRQQNLDLFNEHRLELRRQHQQGDLSDQQYERLLREAELSLLEDSSDSDALAEPHNGGNAGRKPIVLMGGLAVLVLGASVAFYLHYGAIDDVEIANLRSDFMAEQVAAMQGAEVAEGQSDATLNALIAKLEQRLERDPDNVGNHYLLASSYMQQGRYGDAVREYGAIISRGEPPAYIIGETAQAVFLASGNRITPEVKALAGRALELDPRETTSLGLSGIDAFEQQQYDKAIGFWQRAVALIGTDSPGGQNLVMGINRARQLLAESGAVPTGPSEQTEVDQAEISVDIEIGDGVSLPADATVFVYARAWQGPKMPLAITRLTVADLPRTVVLSDAMAMAPGMTLSSADQLELVARVSTSGEPVPQSGDWQATLGPVRLADVAEPLTLAITEQVP